MITISVLKNLYDLIQRIISDVSKNIPQNKMNVYLLDKIPVIYENIKIINKDYLDSFTSLQLRFGKDELSIPQLLEEINIGQYKEKTLRLEVSEQIELLLGFVDKGKIYDFFTVVYSYISFAKKDELMRILAQEKGIFNVPENLKYYYLENIVSNYIKAPRGSRYSFFLIVLGKIFRDNNYEREKVRNAILNFDFDVFTPDNTVDREVLVDELFWGEKEDIRKQKTKKLLDLHIDFLNKDFSAVVWAYEKTQIPL